MQFNQSINILNFPTEIIHQILGELLRVNKFDSVWIKLICKLFNELVDSDHFKRSNLHIQFGVDLGLDVLSKAGIIFDGRSSFYLGGDRVEMCGDCCFNGGSGYALEHVAKHGGVRLVTHVARNCCCYMFDAIAKEGDLCLAKEVLNNLMTIKGSNIVIPKSILELAVKHKDIVAYESFSQFVKIIKNESVLEYLVGKCTLNDINDGCAVQCDVIILFCKLDCVEGVEWCVARGNEYLMEGIEVAVANNCYNVVNYLKEMVDYGCIWECMKVAKSYEMAVCVGSAYPLDEYIIQAQRIKSCRLESIKELGDLGELTYHISVLDCELFLKYPKVIRYIIHRYEDNMQLMVNLAVAAIRLNNIPVAEKCVSVIQYSDNYEDMVDLSILAFNFKRMRIRGLYNDIMGVDYRNCASCERLVVKDDEENGVRCGNRYVYTLIERRLNRSNEFATVAYVHDINDDAYSYKTIRCVSQNVTYYQIDCWGNLDQDISYSEPSYSDSEISNFDDPVDEPNHEPIYFNETYDESSSSDTN